MRVAEIIFLDSFYVNVPPARMRPSNAPRDRPTREVLRGRACAMFFVFLPQLLPGTAGNGEESQRHDTEQQVQERVLLRFTQAARGGAHAHHSRLDAM